MSIQEELDAIFSRMILEDDASQKAADKADVIARASRLLWDYNYDPAQALAAGEDIYSEFSRCWEIVHPNEYIQRARLAGGVQFNFLSTED